MENSFHALDFCDSNSCDVSSFIKENVLFFVSTAVLFGDVAPS